MRRLYMTLLLWSNCDFVCVILSNICGSGKPTLGSEKLKWLDDKRYVGKGLLRPLPTLKHTHTP